MIRIRFNPLTGDLPEDVPQVLDMAEDRPLYDGPEGEAEARALEVMRRRAELAAAVAAFDPLWDARARRRRGAARPGVGGSGPPGSPTAAGQV